MKRPDTHNGLFQPGDPTTRRPGDVLTTGFMNTLMLEVVNVIEGAGIALDKDNDAQLLAAVRALISAGVEPLKNCIKIVDSTPTKNVGSVIWLDGFGELVWTKTAHFEGYRSPLSGAFEWGATTAPQRWQIDAVGGVLQKAAYPGLWAHAQENGLVVVATSWSAGTLRYVDLNSTQFRVPDLRNIFVRATGTDADTATARALGSAQKDALQHIKGELISIGNSMEIGTFLSGLGAFSTINDAQYPLVNAGGILNGRATKATFDAARVARTSVETRAANVALHPRLHV